MGTVYEIEGQVFTSVKLRRGESLEEYIENEEREIGVPASLEGVAMEFSSVHMVMPGKANIRSTEDGDFYEATRTFKARINVDHSLKVKSVLKRLRCYCYDGKERLRCKAKLTEYKSKGVLFGL